MASAASESSEAKELSLIGKVELRIALADSDEKLESLLKTYLAPLLLKLASEHLTVRNKVRDFSSASAYRILYVLCMLTMAGLDRSSRYASISTSESSHSMYRLSGPVSIVFAELSRQSYQTARCRSA